MDRQTIIDHLIAVATELTGDNLRANELVANYIQEADDCEDDGWENDGDLNSREEDFRLYFDCIEEDRETIERIKKGEAEEGR